MDVGETECEWREKKDVATLLTMEKRRKKTKQDIHQHLVLIIYVACMNIVYLLVFIYW